MSRQGGDGSLLCLRRRRRLLLLLRRCKCCNGINERNSIPANERANEGERESISERVFSSIVHSNHSSSHSSTLFARSSRLLFIFFTFASELTTSARDSPIFRS